MKTVFISTSNTGILIEKELPENWDELTRSQFLAYIRIANSNKSEQKKRIELMYHLLNLPYRIFYNMEMETIMDIWLKMDFLSKPPFVTKNIIKGFWKGGIYYLGPESNFGNTLVLETGWWDKFFMDYAKGQNSRDLELAIAAMFRPVNIAKQLNPFYIYDDYRVDFNMASVEKRADKFASLDETLKQAIWVQFQGVRKAFELTYKNVYEVKEGESQASGFGFLELIIDLAGAKFGDVKQVEKKNWTVVLSHLEISEKRAKNKTNPTDGNQTQVYK
jgi:hypothetical protein